MTTIVTRAGKGLPLSIAEMDANLTNLNNDKAENAAVALKAPLDSPALTGTPTAPTPTQGDNDTSIATTAFVNAEIAADRPYSNTNPVMDGTAAQGSSANISRQDHVHPSDTTKANLAGATFTGGVSATTGLTVKSVASGSNDGNVVSGTYTPTFPTYFNCSGAVLKDSRPWRYTRVGAIIHVAGSITLTVTAAGFTYVYFTLPVAGNLANRSDASGAGYARNTSDYPVGVEGNSGADDYVLVKFTSAASGTTDIVFTFSYLIT